MSRVCWASRARSSSPPIRSLAKDSRKKFDKEFEQIRDETFRLNETDVELKLGLEQMASDLENVNLTWKESSYRMQNEYGDMEIRLLKRISDLEAELKSERLRSKSGGGCGSGSASVTSGCESSSLASVNSANFEAHNTPVAKSTPVVAGAATKFHTPAAAEGLGKQLAKSRIPRKSPQ